MPDADSFVERLSAQVDADLAAVAVERMPEAHLRAATQDFLEHAGLFRSPYIESFSAGYRWGKQANVALISVSAEDERQGAIDELTQEYRAAADDAAAGQALATAIHVGQRGRSIMDGEATRFSSPDDAFDHLRSGFPKVSSVPDRGLRNCFHAGAGLFAMETYMLMRVRFLERADRGERLAKRNKYRPRHWWWRLRRR